jgi:hypothetical protein
MQEILKEMELNTGVFARRAVQEAIAGREQITPALLQTLVYAKQNAEQMVDRANYIAHIYAMYLLAQFRERRAYPLIADFFSIPGEITMDLAGDVVTEDLDRILASVSHGDTSLMQDLVEDGSANEYVRNAALRGMLVLVAQGETPRDEVVAYYQSLFQGRLAREYSYVWDGLVSCCTVLHPAEVMEDIEQAFEDGLIDEWSIRIDDVSEQLTRSRQSVLADLKNDQRLTLIEDTVSEMEWWACFRPPGRHSGARTPGQEKTKVGRNAPCPCGSGRKYKRCCGARH